ncbi:MAG: hypothetical protein QOG85_1316 [Gaiellaceae bacterium]|jgi:hypothetical protein|nr:hypothetical protein [Gaiellaceae bacterium]
MKWLVGLGLVALLAACGGAVHAIPRGDAHPSDAPPNVKAIATEREHAALLKAERLLRRVELPPGAERLSRMPVDVYGMTTSELGISVTTMTADRHAFWRSRQSVASVMDFIKTHRVPRLAVQFGGGPFEDGSRYVGFEARGWSMQGQVSVNAVRAGHWTYIRVDAGAPWFYPRSPSEALPAGVREIDLSGGGVSRHVTDGALVARIVRWFGELTVAPPGQAVAVSCGPSAPVDETFVFRSKAGAELARADVPSFPVDGCDPIRFDIGGELQTPLIDASVRAAFVTRVERLLGVCFGAGPTGFKVSPLCNKQWANDVARQLLRSLELPRGAQPLGRAPRGDGGLLRAPESASGGRELVDRHRLWRVRLPLAAAERFVERERHARPTGSSTAGGPGVPPNRSVTFGGVLSNPFLKFAHIPRRRLISSRALQVTFVRLPHGWTGIRADAQVVWVYPRTDAQMVPAHTYAIVVRTGSTTQRITEYQTVERPIILRFDSLEVVQPGVAYHCPALLSRGPTVTIEFRAFKPRVTARAVARGPGFSTGCNPISFIVNGRTTQLVGGGFVRWLEARLRRLS